VRDSIKTAGGLCATVLGLRFLKSRMAITGNPIEQLEAYKEAGIDPPHSVVSGAIQQQEAEERAVEKVNEHDDITIVQELGVLSNGVRAFSYTNEQRNITRESLGFEQSWEKEDPYGNVYTFKYTLMPGEPGWATLKAMAREELM